MQMIDVLKRLAAIDAQTESKDAKADVQAAQIKGVLARDKARKEIDKDERKSRAGAAQAGSAEAEYRKGRVEEGSPERLALIKKMFQQKQRAKHHDDAPPEHDGHDDDHGDLPVPSKRHDYEGGWDSDMDEGSHEDRLALIKQIAQKVKRERDEDLKAILSYIDKLDNDQGIAGGMDDEPSDTSDLVGQDTAQDYEGGWDDLQESTVEECGMMGEVEKPSTPASISITAGSGEEISNMLATIMQLAGVHKVDDKHMGAEPPAAVVTAEPGVAVGPAASAGDEMRSVIDKLNGDSEEGEEGEEETDEGQYDNSPADPTDTNEFDSNQWAYQSNPQGAGKGRGTVQPNATLEAVTANLFNEYQKFLEESENATTGRPLEEAHGDFEFTMDLENPNYNDEDPNSVSSAEFLVTYDLNGKYHPATWDDPAEYPEVIIRSTSVTQVWVNDKLSPNSSKYTIDQLSKLFDIDIKEYLSDKAYDDASEKGFKAPYHDDDRDKYESSAPKSASNKPVDPKDLVVSLKDVPVKKPRGHKQYDPAKEFPGVKAFKKQYEGSQKKTNEDLKGAKYAQNPMNFAYKAQWDPEEEEWVYRKKWDPKLSDKASQEMWAVLRDINKNNKRLDDKERAARKARKQGVSTGSAPKKLSGVDHKPFRRGSE